MTSDFDVIVVGSGPAGVSAAFPLVEAGLRVLMIHGGKSPHIKPLETDFLSARANDKDQWKWMIGNDFHALKMRDAVSPKLRVPAHAYVFDGFGQFNQIRGENYITVGSLATGGLSNAWGCGVARFSASDNIAFPFPDSELEPSYSKVSQRIGISGGTDDDLSEYFGLDQYSQPPIDMDDLHRRLYRNYLSGRQKLINEGFRLGRSRVAVLSKDLSGRQACNLSGNCLWGCARRSLYSAADDLPNLRRYENYRELTGFVVDGLTCNNGYCRVEGKNISHDEGRSFVARKVVLAAGTLATTRIVLKSLNHAQPVPLLSCPTAAFLLWLPTSVGMSRLPGFGFGQLSFTLSLNNDITAFGSTFSTIGIPFSEFLSHVPFRRRYGVDLLRGLLSSCLVGNMFLPGNLTEGSARLNPDGLLSVSGRYRDAVDPLMRDAERKIRRSFLHCGGILLPGSFTIGPPGGDIHYAGTLPMKKLPKIGETSQFGEVNGLEGVHVVDGACLPALPEKSHTLTIMANADRIGRAIAGLGQIYREPTPVSIC